MSTGKELSWVKKAMNHLKEGNEPKLKRFNKDLLEEIERRIKLREFDAKALTGLMNQKTDHQKEAFNEIIYKIDPKTVDTVNKRDKKSSALINEALVLMKVMKIEKDEYLYQISEHKKEIDLLQRLQSILSK